MYPSGQMYPSTQSKMFEMYQNGFDVLGIQVLDTDGHLDTFEPFRFRGTWIHWEHLGLRHMDTNGQLDTFGTFWIWGHLDANGYLDTFGTIWFWRSLIHSSS